MKYAINAILALAIIAMFMVSPVAAATSQGLEWGIHTGDRFDFTLRSSETGLNEQIYLNITSMPATAIPDPLTSWGSIPDPDVGAYWANGTSMGLYILVFLGLLSTGGKIAVPVGNFSLLTNLLAPELIGEDFINDASVWGVELVHELNSTHEGHIRVTYSKSDGFLAEYILTMVVSATDEVVQELSARRNNLGGGIGIDQLVQLAKDNALYIGAAVVVLVILGVVCKRR